MLNNKDLVWLSHGLETLGVSETIHKVVGVCPDCGDSVWVWVDVDKDYVYHCARCMVLYESPRSYD